MRLRRAWAGMGRDAPLGRLYAGVGGHGRANHAYQAHASAMHAYRADHE